MPDYYNVIDNTQFRPYEKSLFHVCNVRRSDVQARTITVLLLVDKLAQSPVTTPAACLPLYHTARYFTQGFSFNVTVGWTTRMLWLNFCCYTTFKPELPLELNHRFRHQNGTEKYNLVDCRFQQRLMKRACLTAAQCVTKDVQTAVQSVQSL
jgi:hypothetical protein